MVAQQEHGGGRHHFLLVCFPMQSHINPARRLARRLTSLGARVTFSTAINGHRRMFPAEADKDCSSPLPDANDTLLSYYPYSDGYDDGVPSPATPPDEYIDRINRLGTETLRGIINSAGQQHPVTCLIYTLFLPWAALVARDLGLPSALFWIQPASMFVIYYHYFHDHRADIEDISKMPLGDADHIHGDGNPADEAANGDVGAHCTLPRAVHLPGLPSLEARDLPSFLVSVPPPGSDGQTGGGDGGSHHSDAAATTIAEDWNKTVLRDFCRSFQILDEELAITGRKSKVLINTFNALETDALLTLTGIMDLVPVGLVVPPACTDPKLAATTTASDLFTHDNKAEYLEWLSRWPARSVIYISFGSFSVMSKAQVDEFVKALGDMGRPFLWVVRKDATVRPDEEALGEKGKLVSWCDQVEVLRHGSVGCFVTHCGWNSTSEAIAAGVPMVTVPQWTDQPMNARLVEGVWKCGVKVAVDGEKKVRAEELQRCVGLVMGDGEEGVAIRNAAADWSDKARAAVSEGGSSDMNLRAFVDGFNLGI